MSKSGIPIVSDVAKVAGDIIKPVATALRPIAPILPFIPIPGMFGLSSLLTRSLLTGALAGFDKKGNFDVGRGVGSGLLAYGIGSLGGPSSTAASTGGAETGAFDVGGMGDAAGSFTTGPTPIPDVSSNMGVDFSTQTPPIVSPSYGEGFDVTAPVAAPAPAPAPAPVSTPTAASTTPRLLTDVKPENITPGVSPGGEPTTASGLTSLAGELGSTLLNKAAANPLQTASTLFTGYGAITTKEELDRQREEAERILQNRKKETAERVAYAKDILRNYPLMYRRLTDADVKRMNLASGGFMPYEDLDGNYAGGGLMYLAKGGMPPRYLSGGGDGMSDSIKATIGGKQEARLADGEFVVPADVVSHLGNGSSNAGAKKLYAMMDRARQARTGKKQQAPAINATRVMPV